MFGYLDRQLGNLGVGLKLALGFTVVLLLTLATTLSGWRALDGAIERSEQLSDIGQLNDLTRDLRAERITYRVLADDTSKTRISRILEQLHNRLSNLQQRASIDQSQQMLAQKLQLLQRLQDDFVTLQSSVDSRDSLRVAMQKQAGVLETVIDELQTQALLKMPGDGQQGSLVGLMDTLGRHIESASQQSLVPAYAFSPGTASPRWAMPRWKRRIPAWGSCCGLPHHWTCRVP